MSTAARGRILSLSVTAVAALAAAGCEGRIGGLPEGTFSPQDPAHPAPSGPSGPSGPTTGPSGPSGTTGPSGPSGTTTEPFEPIPANVAAAKAKDHLTGLPLTSDELRAVAADPHALRGLIDVWMTTPEFRAKTLALFQKTFQQTQLVAGSADQLLHINSFGGGIPGWQTRRLLKSIEESFARTALAIIEEGRPFTETVTTTRFMLNVPLMVALAYQDSIPRNDNDREAINVFWLQDHFPGLREMSTNNVIAGVSTPIPFSETIDPSSPNFMRWYIDRSYDHDVPCEYLHENETALYGAFLAMLGEHGGYEGCIGTAAEGAELTDADYDSWRMVTIRKPAPGETRTIFWDLPKLRDPNTTELVLATPRVGFMTTLAFFANWPTNVDNSYRVTMNQTLIVALGRGFDPSGAVVSTTTAMGQSAHAQPGSSCYGCHQALDPMRNLFWRSYSTTYFQQLLTVDDHWTPIPADGSFSFGSPPITGSGVEDLANAIAVHPRFALAWTQKMCLLANNRECSSDDPETQRIADAFRASHFDFKLLLREVFSSPLVTFAAPTEQGAENGAFTGIARREHFCARLQNRLGIQDVCGERGESVLQAGTATLALSFALGIPGTTYSRADAQAIVPGDPNPFFVAATERLCDLVAPLVVDGPNGVWSAANKETALLDFVTRVMGVPPSDPRSSGLKDILERHYDAALGTGVNDVDALRSTFVAACQSPLAISSGL